jgi:S1-C subfamily serine protease
LARGESTASPRLGVAVAPPRVARRMRRAVGLPERPGLLVRAVEDDSPAAAAGIEPGDLIAAAGGADLTGVDDLYAALDAAGDGALDLTVVRGTEERTVSAKLTEGS